MAQALEELIEEEEEDYLEDGYLDHDPEALAGAEVEELGGEIDPENVDILDPEDLGLQEEDFLLEDAEGADAFGYEEVDENLALDGLDDDDLAQIGNVQDHAHEHQINQYNDFEGFFDQVEPLEEFDGFLGEGIGGIQDAADRIKGDRASKLPEFAREMAVPTTSALQDLGLLKAINANIDHFEVPPGVEERRKEAAKKLYSEKKDFLEQIQANYDVSPFIIGSAPVIEAEMGTSPEEFVETFDGGDSSRVIGEGFRSRGVVGGQYERGIRKLESLARREGNFETEIDYEETVRGTIGEELFHDLDLAESIRNADDVESILFEEEFGRLIGEMMEKNPERGQELIDKRNELKNRIDEEKRNEALKYAMKQGIEDSEIGEEAYREIIESESPDLGFLRQENVEGMLESLAEEHLSDDCSAYHEARVLADNMDGREVEFELYDKSFENMPYRADRDLPCTFPGSSHAKSAVFTSYMLDPATQIGKIETDKGEGVALMKLVEHEGDGFLYVHSVESDRGENIASDKEMAREIQNQIESYAEEISHLRYEVSDSREIEMEGIMYCMDTHNQGTASSFQRALRDYDDPDVEELELEHVGLQHRGFDNDIEHGVSVYQKPVGH
jgi:hypothetical protein